MKIVFAALAAVALGTLVEPALFVGSAAWRPVRPVALAVAPREYQYPWIQPGDTIAMTTSSGAEAACFRAIGNSRLVAQDCGGPRGFHVYLRAYHGKVVLANAYLGDSVGFALRPRAAPSATPCDSVLGAIGFRGDAPLDTAALPSPVCDDFKARALRP